MAAARYEVRLTHGAEDDLEALFDYVSENRSPAEAAALLDKLLKKIETLESFPQRGAIPRELEPLGISEFRQTLVPPNRLIYRVSARKVFVAVIADGRRDMQTLLERRLLGR